MEFYHDVAISRPIVTKLEMLATKISLTDEALNFLFYAALGSFDSCRNFVKSHKILSSLYR